MEDGIINMNRFRRGGDLLGGSGALLKPICKKIGNPELSKLSELSEKTENSENNRKNRLKTLKKHQKT